MSIKKFFDGTSARPLPSDIRRWSAALRRAKDQGCHAVCRFERKRAGLVFEPGRLFLIFRDGDQDVDILDAPWDMALHDWLLDESIRAETTENEAERFGFVLNDKFAPIELRFGNGFFSSVLVNYLHQQGFDEAASTKQALAAIHENQATKGQQEALCAEMIEREIVGIAADVKRLGYDEGVREDILAGAIAGYLDERFSITNSRLLGFR